MSTNKTCPDCGTELPSDAPAGVCPKCLLKAGMNDPAAESADDATRINSSVTAADAPTIPPSENGGDPSNYAPRIGTKVKYFGDYELLNEIARGGMGVVYKARQVRLNRIVALKMILAGEFASEADVERFQTEAEAAAQLDHPGIVPIFEVGEHEGHHYFSMGLVEGESLAHRMANGPLAPKAAAEFVQQIAKAIEYAHDKGVIHRDLKPANILIDKDGQPRVTDFGVAKKVEGDSNLTATGQILGTPSYMPPEQAAGRLGEVGPLADVYSLGAILYAALTGRPPFQASNPMDTLLQVLDNDPVSPRQLDSKIPRDVETICLKCLEKDPRRRYDSAAALQADLSRWLADEPILARPITGAERLVKWVKRRPQVALLTSVILGLIGVVMMVAIVGFAAVLWQWRSAETQRENTEVSLYFNRIALVDRELSAGNSGQAEQVLHACRPDLRGWEWDYLNRVCEADHRTLRADTFLVNETLHPRSVIAAGNGIAFGPQGERIVSTHSTRGGGMIKVRNVATGDLLLDIKAFHGANNNVAGVAVSPDGRQIAAAVSEYGPSQAAVVRTWDAQTGRELLTLRSDATQLLRVAFSADGKLLASDSFKMGRRAAIEVWDATTGEHIHRLPDASHIFKGAAFCFHPDQDRLAASSADGTIKIYEATSGRETMSLLGHKVRVGSLAFSTDGKYLASGDGMFAQATVAHEHEVVIWDMTSGVAKHSLYGHRGAIHAVAFSADGESLASASQDGTVRIWSVTDGETLRVIHGHSQHVIDVAFSPKGRLLASASVDNTIKLWNMSGDPKGHIVCQHDGAVTCVAFSRDSRRLASASADRTIKIWDAKTGVSRAALKGHEDTVRSIAFSPDGSYLASVSSDQTLRIWELPSGKQIHSIPAHYGAVYDVAVSADSSLLATAGEDNMVAIWNPGSGNQLHRISMPLVQSVAFSPDSHRLAAADWNRVVHFFDADGTKELGSLSSQVEGLLSVRFSHDGRRLVLATDKNTVDVWDLPTDYRGKNSSRTDHWAFTLDGHTGVVARAVFSPDDRRIATASHDGTVKIWDARSGQEVLTLRGHAGAVQSVAFSPDGSLLASADTEGTVIIWDGTTQ